MKSPFSIGVLLISCLALGGVLLQQRHIASLEKRVTELKEASGGRAEEPSGSALEALAGRVERLERANAWRAAAPQPAAPGAAPAPGAPALAATGEVQQLREDVDALLTGEATATEQGKARLRALIAETQQQQWTERMERRDERVLQRLTEVARLNPRQREDLSKVLEAERTQRRTLMANARGGQGSPEELRPALQALRTQTEQKARAILDAEQFTQFTTARAPGRGPRGGGGPGGGGGGAGGDAPR